MKLKLLPSDSGDCLLLTGAEGRHVLVDGGERSAYQRHVAAVLGRLRKKGERLDVVYVSHIDSDHIAGVLQMMDDLVAWRVRDFHANGGGGGNVSDPEVPRPPEVGQIWHNAFHEQVGKNAGPIGQTLAARATIFEGDPRKVFQDLAASSRRLANSQTEAIRLARRVGAKQLGIPVNPPSQHRLLFAREGGQGSIAVGGMRLRVLGPFERDLEKLRKEWNDWLRTHQAQLDDLQAKARADEERLGNAVERVIRPRLGQAEALARGLKLVDGLGRRSEVTTPNLASLMLLVEEAGRTILLTGDGHWEDILKGLRQVGKLGAQGGVHVNVLKVQHHGSEHNIKDEFVKAVTADHYVFCGNGANENPDPRVVDLIARSRQAGSPVVGSTPEATTRPFKFWFNSSESASVAAPAHMRAVEQQVRALAQASGGRMRFSFQKTKPQVLTV